jgi:hypothetical protein
MGAIGVIIHEVGHNYFPMIVNSDERQWSWMDEGLNAFVQFLAQSEFDNNYRARRGSASQIASYMRQPKDRLEPIMTNSENIVDFGSNAYAKPASALNILRETVMGRELFDKAFREYARRWAFKHPTPADFFRSLEDASGIDLDWFWRGWFYGIDAVDISLDSIVWYKANLEEDPEPRKFDRKERAEKPADDISKIRNKESGMKFAVDQDPELKDFYNNYRPWETEDSVQNVTMNMYNVTLSKKEKQELYSKKNYYELSFSNKGGLVMPIILEWNYEDGTKEIQRIPAEIWRLNENSVTKVFVKDKIISAVKIDPYRETADINERNNSAPIPVQPKLFKVYKDNKNEPIPNPMQKAKGAIKP